MRQLISRTVRGTFEHLRPMGLQPGVMMRWLTALSLAVTLAMLVLGGTILFDLRASAWHQSEQSADNLILALSRDIARNITLYDLSIQNTIKALAEPRLAQADPVVRQMALFGSASTAEYLGSMMVTNAEGDVVASSLSIVPPAYSIATREHFLVHKQRPDVGLFISRPIDGKVAKVKIIVFSRRVDNPDGSFGGVAVGAMRVAYFHNLFDKLNLGPNGSVALFRSDGRMIMRRPFNPDDIDKDLSKAATFQQYLTAPHGHFVGTAAIDGVKRLYTFHHIENLPLYLSIAYGVEDIYADWWRKAVGIGAILTLLCAASAVLCLLFRREIMRRMAAETSLQKAASRLSLIAATDGLTGIANRRSFEEALTQEWRRAIRGETVLVILMLDVDCFKLFNDQDGHQMGDEVLQAVAGCMAKNACRPADLVARYGGEEFIALMPETELQGALIIAESLRSAVAHLSIAHVHSPTGFVTVSIGVAANHPAVGDEPAALVKLADDALYAAKRAGRNRVMSGTAVNPPVALLENLSLVPAHSNT